MAWIQVDDTLREHRKTYALADALGIEDYAAVGLTVGAAKRGGRRPFRFPSPRDCARVRLDRQRGGSARRT